MQYHITPRGIELPHMPDFDLAETLDCGQCFRWDPLPDGSFRGIAFQRQLHIYQDGDTFVLDGVREEDFQKYWREYFDLDFDYGAVRSQLSAWDPVMAQAARFAPGIRVLKQEPWEALCSFIISQNNNISRIKGIIARLCQCFGDPIPGGGYSFPEAERLCGFAIQTPAEIRAALDWFAEQGVEETVLSLGAQGTAVGTGQQRLLMTLDPLEPVNTTGAGDCFFAVYVSLRTQGASIADAAECAAAGAALTLSDPLSVSPLLNRQALTLWRSRLHCRWLDLNPN